MQDLFSPIVEASKQHPNFASIADESLFGPEQKVIRQWASSFVDRDNKFVHEFQTTFNPCFWELYLHAAFEELGFSADYSKATPDFLLQHPQGAIVAEAVTAAHPDGHRPEWDHPDIREAPKMDNEQFLSLASVRLANAISSKELKYKEKYSQLPYVQGKPFVICLAPFEQPFFFMQNDNALRRVLYGVDRMITKDDEELNTRFIQGDTRVTTVLKPNGSFVPLGLFTRPGLEHVSAVVFSNTATWTKVRALAGEGEYPVMLFGCRYNANKLQFRVDQALRPKYKETLLDGLHVFLNPFATHPLPTDPFHGREIAVHRFEPETKNYTVDAPDGFLFQHSSMSFMGQDRGQQLVGRTTNTGNHYPNYALPPFPPRDLVPFEGEMGVFTQQHLAHHRGWTILVALDAGDQDWGDQAIKGHAYSISDFIKQNPDADWIMPSEWHKTKEQAFEECLRKVDQRVDPKGNLKQRKKILEAKKRKRKKN
jgi:hypothetical protein